jgi:molybdate transport system ATP-binding protein
MHHLSVIVKNVSAKWQSNTVLDNVSFILNPNGHLLITGDSGSGKTMLGKALAGKVFYRGSIEFQASGQPVKPAVLFVEQHYYFKNRSNVNGFYYQQRFNSFDADDAPTIEEELQKIIKTVDDADNKVIELLEHFDLLHRAQSPLLHLSSGEHKRFQLVKALLQSPQCLVLDEPFTGLDSQTRLKLQHIIDDLAAKGTTCIIICNPSDAPACITHIATLNSGLLEAFVTRNNYDLKTSASIKTLAVINEPLNAIHVNYTAAVVFNNVSVSYGSKQILNNINWRVKHGEKWLLKGKNGAGKSILLSLITGDNPQAYANDIYLFGKKRGTGESIWDIKKNIGYVSPELQWYFDTCTNCFDAVASGFFDTIGLFRALNHTQEKAVKYWLQYFELSTHSQHMLAALPAGKQRLVLLARAMVKNPPVLILDEPCQGLDQHQKDYFIQLTDALCTNTERTLIYVTHYHEDVPSCVNKVLELQDGRGIIYNYSGNHTIVVANE